MRKGTEEKIEKIKVVLEESKGEMWLQDLARKCSMKSGSIYYFINRYLFDEVEFVKIIKKDSIRVNPYITFVKLKK